MTERNPYRVIELKGWSYIEGPNGVLDGPWRYKWEAEEEAERKAAAWTPDPKRLTNRADGEQAINPQSDAPETK